MDAQTVTIIGSSLAVSGTLIAAIITIIGQGRSSKRRATVDLAVDQKKDTALRDASRLLFRLIKEDVNLSAFCNMHDSEEYKAIMHILNSHELVACGIKEGAYDEHLYKRLKYTAVMQNWSALQGFAHQMRTQMNSKTLYQDFEWLANKWAKKPLKAK